MADPGFDAITAFDRPGLAAARLLEGNFGAASRAAFAPRSLSLSERKSLVASLIGEREAETTMGKALSVISNPMVMMGAVLAVRYPVQSVVNMGKIASRFGGYDRWVNPVARLVGALEDTFRGTPVPKLFRRVTRAVFGHSEKYLGEAEGGLTNLLHGYSKRAGTDLTSQGSYRIFMKLDGLDSMVKGDTGYIVAKRLGLPYAVKPIQLASSEQWLFDKLRGPWMSGQRTRITAAMKGGLNDQGLVVPGTTEVKTIRKYAPHMLVSTPRKVEEDTLTLMKEAAVGKRATKGLSKVTTVHAKDRHNGMFPSRDDLALVDQGALHPELRARLQAQMQNQHARHILDPVKYAPPKEYTMNLVPTLERYTNSVGRAYAWTGHPGRYGHAIQKEIAIAKASGPNGVVKAQMLEDVYVPWARGQQSFTQGVKAAEWAGLKKWSMDTLQSPTIQQYVPKQWRKTLEDMILTGHTMKSPGTAGAGLAGWFYVSALGGSVSSGALNLMQTLLTTVPVIGARWTSRGMESTFKKGSKYFQLRGKGLTDAEAIAEAFPEFRAAGASGISVFDAAPLNQAWQTAGKLPGGLRSTTQRVSKAMMSWFSGTEKFNRFTAFEGARLKALSEGVRGQRVLDFAAETMEATQFTPGLSGTPFLMRPGGPLGQPLLRQFTTFGAKYATWLAGNLKGAASKNLKTGLITQDPVKLGQLGRGMLTSGVAYEVAKRFADVDISRGLMFGALPQPHHDSPLGVFPFAPPAVSLPAAALKSVLDEDLGPIQQELPLLMPSGVAATRAFGLLAGRVGTPESVVRGVSAVLGREYADYERPDVQGKIPVFTSDGRLKDYFTRGQILMKASGLPAGDMQQEAEFMSFLAKNKEEMQDAKRSWLDAHMNNDVEGKRAIANDYKARFQIDIPIRKSDLKRAQERRNVTRLERMMKTMPREIQPQFQALLGTAISSQAQGQAPPPLY